MPSEPAAAAGSAGSASSSSSSSTTPKKDCIETIVDLGKIDLNEPKEKRKHHHQRHKEAANELNQKVHKRMASLTESEACFLKALLIDNETTTATSSDDDDVDNNRNHNHNLFKYNNKETDEELRISLLRKASDKLNDEMLFSVPKQIQDHKANSISATTSSKSKNKHQRNNYDSAPAPTPPNRKSNHGLWLAHRDGVHPKKLISLAERLFHRNTNNNKQNKTSNCTDDDIDQEPFPQQSQPTLQNTTHATHAFGSMKSNRNRANSSSSGGSGRARRKPRSPASSLRKSDLPPLPVPSPRKSQSHRRALSGGSAASLSSSLYSYGSEDDIPSDEEVRPEMDPNQTATAPDDDSSWDSQYDANRRTANGSSLH